MRLSVSWTMGLGCKTFLTACRNALGWGAGGWDSIQKIERCFCQTGRVRFTAKGGKQLVQAEAMQMDGSPG